MAGADVWYSSSGAWRERESNERSWARSRSPKRGAWPRDGQGPGHAYGQTDDSLPDRQWSKWEQREQRPERSEWEKMSRWITYVLRAGHGDLNVTMSDGWACIDDLCQAMQQDKPRFGVYDAETLICRIEGQDAEGRFEVNDGWITKVERKDRIQRHESVSVPQRSRGAVAWKECKKERGDRSDKGERGDWEKMSRWITGVLRYNHGNLNVEMKDGCWANIDDLCLAIEQDRPRFGQFDRESLISYIQGNDAEGRYEMQDVWIRKLERKERWRSQRVKDEPSWAPSPLRNMAVKEEVNEPDEEPEDIIKPPPPPGRGWEQFVDDGVNWWHYNGPEGQFWCSEEDVFDIKVFEEDA